MTRREMMSSRWYRAGFVFAVLVGDGASALGIAWLIGSYFVEGCGTNWPSKTLTTVPLGIVLAAAGGVLRKALPWPQPLRRELLGRIGFWTTYRLLCAAGAVSLLRFVVPLMWRQAPLLGTPLTLSVASWWYALLVASTATLHLLPLTTHDVRETADELLARDHRKPVVYLRSFEKELRKTGGRGLFNKYLQHAKAGANGFYLTAGADVRYHGRAKERRALGVARSAFDEQMVLAAAFDTLGPYVALGRPDEDFRTMDVGAAKKYVQNHEWQEAVGRWLESCAAVVIEAADSDSLAWELQQTVRLVAPQRVLIVCPETTEQWEAFRARSAYIFPESLPLKRPNGRFLVFDGTWKPNELRNLNADALATLQPFFETAKAIPQSATKQTCPVRLRKPSDGSEKRGQATSRG